MGLRSSEAIPTMLHINCSIAVDGFVMRFSPTTVLIVNVTKEWVDAGEYDALKAAKPGAYNREDNWVSMPRSILKNHDVSVDLGDAKIVTMHIRVAAVLSHVAECVRVAEGASAEPVVGVPVAAPV